MVVAAAVLLAVESVMVVVVEMAVVEVHCSPSANYSVLVVESVVVLLVAEEVVVERFVAVVSLVLFVYFVYLTCYLHDFVDIDYLSYYYCYNS